MAKSNEPIWWSLFGLGGVVAALLTPAFIIVTGLVLPNLDPTRSDAASYDHIVALARSLPGRIVLFAVISLPLFHLAHRFRYTLIDLGLHGARALVAALCYGAAIAGTAYALYLAVTI